MTAAPARMTTTAAPGPYPPPNAISRSVKDASAVAAESPPECMPAPRFEWERVLREVTLRPPSVKLVAFILGSYADKDGTRVRPGVAALARQAGVDEKTVKRATVTLREAGLIERVRHGNRWANQVDEYRLTLPRGLRFMPELTIDAVEHVDSPGDTGVPSIGVRSSQSGGQ